MGPMSGVARMDHILLGFSAWWPEGSIYVHGRQPYLLPKHRTNENADGPIGPLICQLFNDFLGWIISSCPAFSILDIIYYDRPKYRGRAEVAFATYVLNDRLENLQFSSIKQDPTGLFILNLTETSRTKQLLIPVRITLPEPSKRHVHQWLQICV